MSNQTTTETDYRLSLELERVLTNALENRKKKLIHALLESEGMDEITEEFMDEFYAQGKHNDVEDLFFYGGEHSKVVKQFWLNHPYDNLRLTSREKAEIEDLIGDIEHNDIHDDAKAELTKGLAPTVSYTKVA